jgi:hypothetical protein
VNVYVSKSWGPMARLSVTVKFPHERRLKPI